MMIKRNSSSVVFSCLVLIFLAGFVYAETELEPIVVKHASYGSREEVLTSVLEEDDIEKIAANTPEDILNYLSVDVQTRGFYGVKSDVSLNASTFQQVLILVNGVPVNDPQTAHHNLDLFFNKDDIERIEIIPAGRSSVYGPNGIGGAINFVLKRPQGKKGYVSAAGGNYDTFEGKLNLAYGPQDFSNRLSFDHAQSNGCRYDTDFRSSTFFHSSAVEKGKASLFMDAGYNEKEFGAYDFYTPGKNYPSKEWTNTGFFDVRGLLKGEHFSFEPRFDFRQHHDKFMLDITRPGLYLNHHRTDMFLAGGRFEFPHDGLKLSTGADYGEDRISSNNLGKHNRQHWDMYADSLWQFSDSLNAQVSLRVDDYSTFKEELTGSVLLKRLFSDASDIYATFGRSIRIPTFTELYYSDPTTGSDPDLKPEQALSLECGWNKKFFENLNGSFSFFVRQEYDTIDFVKNTPSDPKFIAANISEGSTQGLNFFTRWRAAQNLTVDFRYFFANKHMKGCSKIYKYGLNYTKHMLDLGIDSGFSFGHNRVDFIMKKKPGRRAWVLVNDRFTFDVSKNVGLFCEVYNLLNVEYQEIEGIPESDRQFKCGIQFQW